MTIDITLDPTVVAFGPIAVGWHGILTMLAVAVALWYGTHRAERTGLDLAVIEPAVTVAIVGGFIGARVFHVLDHMDYYSQSPLEMFLLWQGGMAAYGGFIGGLSAGIIYARRVGLSVWRVLDAAAPALLVGQIIGRLGCLSNGDAWGAPTGQDYGVVYWNEHASIPASLIGIPTHPYPLYEMVVLALALGVLLWLAPRLELPGQLFLLVVISYAVARFALTFVRQEPLVFAGLQEAQILAFITTIVALAVMPMLRPARAGTVSAASR
jgi:phosphatidylglycerol:prolipoprotein diacylglycerol transferase